MPGAVSAFWPKESIGLLAALMLDRPAPLGSLTIDTQPDLCCAAAPLTPGSPVRPEGALPTSVRLQTLHCEASVAGGVVGRGDGSLGMADGLSIRGAKPTGLAPR